MVKKCPERIEVPSKLQSARVRLWFVRSGVLRCKGRIIIANADVPHEMKFPALQCTTKELLSFNSVGEMLMKRCITTG